MSDQRNLDIHFILGVFLKYCWLILFTSVLIGGNVCVQPFLCAEDLPCYG